MVGSSLVDAADAHDHLSASPNDVTRRLFDDFLSQLDGQATRRQIRGICPSGGQPPEEPLLRFALGDLDRMLTGQGCRDQKIDLQAPYRRIEQKTEQPVAAILAAAAREVRQE